MVEGFGLAFGAQVRCPVFEFRVSGSAPRHTGSRVLAWVLEAVFGSEVPAVHVCCDIPFIPKALNAKPKAA